MRGIARLIPGLAGILFFACSGCSHVPGEPAASVETVRPDKQLDFHVLFQENCSGCHGANGRGGPAISLNNPAYLALAGADNLRNVVAKGSPGTLMPAFAASAGGMLTDQQVDALAEGMLRTWARPAEFAGVALPSYQANAPSEAANGQKAYAAACARCHGDEGAGVKAVATAPAQPVSMPNSIVDPSYLALVSDQSLRSILIAGHPDSSTPDWRTYIAGRALTPQEITDIVAWIAQHREPPSGQSILNPRANPAGSLPPARPDLDRKGKP